jgi:hypothetical protein
VVAVGVFLKRRRKIGEIRHGPRNVGVWLLLPMVIDHPRFTRTLATSQEMTAHFLRVERIQDVDDELRGWLTLAYEAAK